MNLRSLLLIVLFYPSLGFSHSLSDSYLSVVLEDTRVTGHWLIAVRDLELAVGLDSNTDGSVTWGEIVGQRSRIEGHALSHMVLSRNDMACDLALDAPMLEELNSGIFVHLPLSGVCNGDGPLHLDYNLQFAIDSSHRSIVTLQEGEEIQSTILSPSRRSAEFSSNSISVFEQYRTFVIEGVWHIWIGLDHILFLVAILVPVVVGRRGTDAPNGWLLSGKPSRWNDFAMYTGILKVVTAFTVAHSITLVLATLEWIVLPARLVESVIALSVALSGVNILYPIFRGHQWQIAFAFGLIHGFGFAGVLADLSLPTQLFIGSLLSFNIGVEIGQLAIVLVVVPALLILTNAALTRRVTEVIAGIAITGCGLLWVAERY